MAENRPEDLSGDGSPQNRLAVEIQQTQSNTHDPYPQFFPDKEGESNEGTKLTSRPSPRPSLRFLRKSGPSSAIPQNTATTKPRKRLLTLVKYIIAVPLLLLGLLCLYLALSPVYYPLRSDMWFALLLSAILLIPTLWFLAFEAIDLWRQRKGQNRSNRRWWLAASLTVASLVAAYFGPSSGAASISKVGDFRDVLTVHDEAEEECIESVRNRAKYPASTKFGESISSISASAAGDGVTHTFAGIMHFPNGFGVLSEYSFVCKMVQEGRYSSSITSDASLKLNDLNVKEKSFRFSPDREIQPTGDFHLIPLSEVRGIKAMNNPPEEIYILPGRFTEAHT